MSQVEDHLAVLQHMDGALAAMRQGLSVVREGNTETTERITELWGGGNDLAGRLAKNFMAVDDHLGKLDMMLFGAQVEAAHAALILGRALGKES